MVGLLVVVRDAGNQMLYFQKDPLEKGMVTHSSILAWRIPWTEEPGGCYSPWGCRVGHTWGTNTFTLLFPCKILQTHKCTGGGQGHHVSEAGCPPCRRFSRMGDLLGRQYSELPLKSVFCKSKTSSHTIQWTGQMVILDNHLRKDVFLWNFLRVVKWSCSNIQYRISMAILISSKF